MGRGPVVYLLINNGNSICMGTMGTPSKASFSFGIPASMSFSPVTESAAANPI